MGCSGFYGGCCRYEEDSGREDIQRVFIKAETFEVNFQRKVRLSEANKTERVVRQHEETQAKHWGLRVEFPEYVQRRVCKGKATKDEAKSAGRGQVMKGLVYHSENLSLRDSMANMRFAQVYPFVDSLLGITPQNGLLGYRGDIFLATLCSYST